MWNCPKCMKPQTLLDMALRDDGHWEQLHFVPYTEMYQYTSLIYKGIEIGVRYTARQSRVNIVRIEPAQHTLYECNCGQTLNVIPANKGQVFFQGLTFFGEKIKPLVMPKVDSCETFIRFTENSKTHGRESSARDYILRHVKGSYLERRGDDELWLVWFRPTLRALTI